MLEEFKMNMKLKGAELNTKKEIAGAKTQQTQKPKEFESSGNDVLGGIDLSRFEPR